MSNEKKTLERQVWELLCDNNMYTASITEISTAISNFIRQREGWISVKDRLPEKPGYYICWCTGDEPGLIHYHPNTGWQNGFYNNNVTHWKNIKPPTQ